MKKLFIILLAIFVACLFIGCIPKFELTITIVGTGTVTADGTTITSGTPIVFSENEEVELIVTPGNNYQFDGWTGTNGADVTAGTPENHYTIIMNSAKSITATFTESVIKHTLTVTIVGNGSVTANGNAVVSGTPVEFNEGTVVTLATNPETGWQFDGWSGANASDITANQITMNADKAITATFSEITGTTYTLTITIVGNGGVTANSIPVVSGTPITYNENTVVTLAANPDTGWQFDGWSGANAGDIVSNQITMNSNKVITATFTEIPATTFTLIIRVPNNLWQDGSGYEILLDSDGVVVTDAGALDASITTYTALYQTTNIIPVPINFPPTPTGSFVDTQYTIEQGTYDVVVTNPTLQTGWDGTTFTGAEPTSSTGANPTYIPGLFNARTFIAGHTYVVLIAGTSSTGEDICVGEEGVPAIAVSYMSTVIPDNPSTITNIGAVGNGEQFFFEVRSNGVGALNITSITASSLPAGLTLTTNPGAATLDYSQSVQIGFTATANVTDSGVVAIAHSADGSPFEFKFSCNAVTFTNVIVGTGTNATHYLPVNDYYYYVYSQSIYLKSELGDRPSQSIYKIRLQIQTQNAQAIYSPVTIYIGHTTKTTFTSTTNWEPIANLTQVWTGTINVSGLTSGTWYEIPLTTPFPYNNTSNLIVAFDQDDSDYGNNQSGFAGTTGANRSLRRQSDTVNIDPASPGTGTRVGFFPNMTFVFGD